MRPSNWLSAKLKTLFRNISIETNFGGDIIGRKYLKSDEVGTPFALVVDDQSVDSGTVTIRDRDTLQQKRIPQSDIPGIRDSRYECDIQYLTYNIM